MSDLDARITAWVAKHWPWSMPAVWVAAMAAIGVPLLLILGTDSLPNMAIQVPILALAPTFGACRGPYRARKAARDGSDEDVAAVMSYVDRDRGDLDPRQRTMAEQFARRELASVDRRSVVLRVALVAVLLGLVAALFAGPVAGLVVGVIAAVGSYALGESLSVSRRRHLEEVLTRLGT